MLDVCLLGTGGMMPLPGRWLTSLLMRYNGKMILIDCGEGTQIPLKQVGWGFKAIDAIFFTHFHADHIAGLPGLLLTIGNSDKDTPLDLIGPPGLLHIVRSLLVICPQLPYEIRVIELPFASSVGGVTGGRYGSIGDSSSSGDRSDSCSCSSEDSGILAPLRDIALFDRMTFKYAPADHSAPCLSYSFSISRGGLFIPERAKELKIPITLWKVLQSGQSVELSDGRKITPDMVLGAPRKGIKLSYCTDSRPTAKLCELFFGADLLICEGLYGDDSERDNARSKKHMVFSEAASMAARAGVGELWLTHYSPAMQKPSEHIGSARRVFGNSFAGRDLLTKTLVFHDIRC